MNEVPQMDQSKFAALAEEQARSPAIQAAQAVKMVARDVNCFYGEKQALFNVNVDINDKAVTAFIGPSGCGKSTFLRCLNRMNDFIDIARVTGRIEIDGEDIYDPKIDPVQLRARVGMVFQKPNPFPKSIFDNVAYGPRIHGLASSKVELEEIVHTSLEKAGLWSEVKDRLQRARNRPLRRPAAAPVHRARHRRQPGGDPHGRALLGARPDRHGQDRGADRRASPEFLHRDRHPLHAAGRPCFSTHSIFPPWRPC